jgi:hypothetical protein
MSGIISSLVSSVTTGAVSKVGSAVLPGLVSGLGGALQGIVAGASGASGATLPGYFDAQNQADAAQAWMWTANISNISGLPAFNNIPLIDITVPFEGFTADPRFRGGFTYNFPKFTNITQMTMTFHELQTYPITNYFAAWHNQIIDVGQNGPSTAGNYSLPINYWGRVVVTLFDTMGIPALEITYVGVWPERVNDFTLSTTSSGALQLSVNLALSRGFISYAGSTLLDSPFAQLVSGNPMASLSKVASLGVASLKSQAFSQIGKLL